MPGQTAAAAATNAAWLWLLVAAACEIAWAIGLKFSQAFTRPGPTAFTIVFMLASFYFLSLAMRDLPAGTAYAVWTGIGAVGVAALGILWLGEPVSLLRLASIALIVLGILGLKWSATMP